MKESTERKLVVFGFLFIPVVLLLVFKYYTAGKLVQYSFTDWNGISKTLNYIGWENYKKIFTNPEYLKIFAHNFAYLFAGIVQNIIALLLAVMLVGKTRLRNTFRTFIFMPYLMNAVAVSYMFSFMYDYSEGAFNALLNLFNLTGIHWLSNPAIVNYSLAFITLWRFVGYSMVIYIAGLQAIDNQVYEASDIDGANAWQKFRYITLPSIKPTVQLNMFLSITGAVKAFNEAFAVTNGGPNGASTTFVFKTVETAFQYNNFGLASALGVVLLIFLGILTVVQNKVFGSED